MNSFLTRVPQSSHLTQQYLSPQNASAFQPASSVVPAQLFAAPISPLVSDGYVLQRVTSPFATFSSPVPAPVCIMSENYAQSVPIAAAAKGSSPVHQGASSLAVTRGGQSIVNRQDGSVDIYEIYDVSFGASEQSLIRDRIAGKQSGLRLVPEFVLKDEIALSIPDAAGGEALAFKVDRDEKLALYFDEAPAPQEGPASTAEETAEVQVRCHGLMRIPVAVNGRNYFVLMQGEAAGGGDASNLVLPSAIIGGLTPRAVLHLDSLGAHEFVKLGDHDVPEKIQQPAEAEQDLETKRMVEYIRRRLDDGLSFKMPRQNLAEFLKWFDSGEGREIDGLRPIFNLLQRDNGVLSIPEWTRISGAMPYAKYGEKYLTLEATMGSALYQDLRREFIRGNGMDASKGVLLDRAVSISFQHYDSATKKIRDDGRHYIAHPLEIAYHYVVGFGFCDAVGVLASLFHDLIEDTDASMQLMRSQFSGLIADDDFARIIEIVEKDLTEDDLYRALRNVSYSSSDGNSYRGRVATKIELIDRSLRRYNEHKDQVGVIIKAIDRTQNSFVNWRGANYIQRRLEIPEIDRWFSFMSQIPVIPPVLREQLSYLLGYERELVEITEPTRARAAAEATQKKGQVVAPSKPLDPASIMAAASARILDPEKLLEQLVADPELAALYRTKNGEHTHETIYSHTLSVLEEFELQFNARRRLGLNFLGEAAIMRLAVALHDVGKAVSIYDQTDETGKIIRKKFSEWGLAESDAALASSLIAGSDIGLLMFWYHNIDVETTLASQEEKAASAGVDIASFMNMKLLYYLADSSAYPIVRATMHYREADHRLRIKREWTPLARLFERVREKSAGAFDPANFMTENPVERDGYLAREVMNMRWQGRESGVTLARSDGRELPELRELDRRLKGLFTARLGADLDVVDLDGLAALQNELLKRAEGMDIGKTVLILKSSDAEKLNAMKVWANSVGLKTTAIIPVSLMAPDSPQLMRHHVWSVHQGNDAFSSMAEALLMLAR